MSQHFLLSAQARTLSVAKVARMTDEEAREVFRAIRWADNDGQPYCPRCGCVAVYEHASRPIWSCQACQAQFSVTSGTIFASRKRPLKDYLLAIALFVNGAKGMPALQLARDLDCQYRTAYVLAHKLREAMAADQHDAKVGGPNEIVEVDGAYFGGYIRPENRKVDRKDRRLAENRSGKRRVVVALRQRQGRTLPFVFYDEARSHRTIVDRVKPGSTVYADESRAWDRLHSQFDVGRVNHGVTFMDDGVCTNQVESFFSRLRRAEIGQHHHISGRYLDCYAREMAWREDNSREDNGTLFRLVAAAAAAHPPSRDWSGYWQRDR
ncbi:MAG: IS1595 family transposase [Alphaproteobacteria bacterium]